MEVFWIFVKIRGDIREFTCMFITGVNDTGEKFIAGFVDTSEQFIFPRCRWYRSEKTKKPKT